MRIAVCDDCIDDALTLEKYLDGQEVRIYSDAESLLTDIEDKKELYDLYLLDIFIKEFSGIKLAERLRAVQEEALICFVSNSDDFYREAYDLYALQYLIKPVWEEDIGRLLRKAEKNLLRTSVEREKTFAYSWRGKTGAIPYGKIRYIGSRGHVLLICCTDGRIQESTGKLNELEQQICGDIFLRCHQSFIVNIYQVEGMSGSELLVAGERVPVSRRYYAEVKRRYQRMLFEEVD